MSNFRKYQHLERFGTTEVEGIELGVCYVFPKIDGTNASVWCHEGTIYGGSRNRTLTIDNDNAGFYAWTCEKIDKFVNFFSANPHLRLYGEWLVPHSFKDYEDSAWRKFYVFDVAADKGESEVEYLPYEIYKPILEEYGIDYIPPLAIIKNGSYDQFIQKLQANVFLVKDGKGAGEGIVVKNYDFYNRYGRQTWAKIVSNEFKETHYKTMGPPEVNGQQLVEQQIVDKFITQSLVDKVHAKIRSERQGWSSKFIPELLERTFYDLINEDMYHAIKTFKPTTVNFKTLRALTINKVKEYKPQIFN